LVGDAVGAFELHALVVEDVVAERIFEIHIERETLPRQRGEDVTVNIGVGVTDFHAVGFVDPTVAVLVAGLISMLWTPMLGILIAILGGAVAAVAFYFGRQPYYEGYGDYDEYEEEYEETDEAEEDSKA